MTSRVLIIQSECSIPAQLREFFEQRHVWLFDAPTLESAKEMLVKQPFHLVVWPLSGENDFSAISWVKQQRPTTAVLAVSARTDPDHVVRCIRAGASQFWAQGSDVANLCTIAGELLERTSTETSHDAELSAAFPCFIGRHPRLLEVLQVIHAIRNSDSNVLITGESGTGKEIVARAIHDVSPRAKLPWVAVNCGAIPSTLLESELFGHVKGAFTGATQNRIGRFQLAGKGTLFLDEISDLPFDIQAKLLRAIQNRQFEPVGTPHSQTLEARIIAATNQDLEQAVSEKKFRQDLYYRMNVIPIVIPPLRNRRSDIPVLVGHFLEKFCRENSREALGISEEAMHFLMQYHWPGNIRELENLVERVVVLKRDKGIIELKDLPAQHFSQLRVDSFVANVSLPDEGIDLSEAVNEFENELILQALQKTAGNKNKAASLLNLNRTTLVEKLKRKGLRLAA